VRAAVIDTNVLVSGLLSPHGAPGRLVDAMVDGLVQLVVDDRILDEYEDVLRRPLFQFLPEDIDRVLVLIRTRAHHVSSVSVHVAAEQLPDPDDAPFLECAIAMSVPLVTGNVKHYPRAVRQGAELLSPATCLARLASDGSG